MLPTSPHCGFPELLCLDFSIVHKPVSAYSLSSMNPSLVTPCSSWSLQLPECVDTPDRGYQCQPQLSHNWGQYSPFFSIRSETSTAIPSGCQITFAQVLSRHGARNPTATKTRSYYSTIRKLRIAVGKFRGKYAFLNRFKYTLGANQLTTFGEQQMINSGIVFYNRYKALAKQRTPFIRASGQDRVVKSARKFSQGFHQAKTADRTPDENYPHSILVIPEGEGYNNTYVYLSAFDTHLVMLTDERSLASTTGSALSLKRLWPTAPLVAKRSKRS